MKRFWNRTRRSHTRSLLLCGCGLLAFLALAYGTSGAKAKYIHETAQALPASSAEFYFTSDLLDGSTHTLAKGTESLTFCLKNQADQLRYADMDIAYMVTVDNDATVSPASGTLSGGSQEEATITLSGLEPGKTYTVTATSSPYQKVLTGTFQVPAWEEGLSCTASRQGDALTLTLLAGDTDATATVSYPDTLVPDNTNSNMTDWAADGTEYSLSLEAETSCVLRFFGTGKVTVNGKAVG